MKKAQSAIEMAVLLGFMLLVFSVFFVLVSNKMVDVQKANDKLLLDDVAYSIKTEVETAGFVENGYSRQFEVPENIEGRDYNITLKNESGNYSVLILQYTDSIVTGEFVYVIPKVANDGKINKGCNTITKKEGVISIIDRC